MREPHGGRLVNRVVAGSAAERVREQLVDPVIQLDWNQYQDLVNIATGRFSPLEGFLTRNDFVKVVNDLALEDGTVWPLPVTLDVSAESAENLAPGETVGLQGPDGTLVGAIEVEEVYRENKESAAAEIYGTKDSSHPGVEAYLSQKSFFVGGPIHLFGERRYNDYDLLPAESRVLFRHRGWDTVVGFQTRNAPHRAHEYIQRSALEQVGGLLIQPKVGNKKVDDYRNDVILGAYDTLIENYYNPSRVALSVLPSKMRYAGPREAVFDALVRKNQGCTHFVVGRDHAGVGDYYDEFGAQEIFERIGEVGIDVMRYDYAFYCERCDGMTSEKVCPHDETVQIHPSGTKIRKQIRAGTFPSEKIMRPEVAEYIMTVDEPFVTESLAGASQ